MMSAPREVQIPVGEVQGKHATRRQPVGLRTLSPLEG